MASSNNNSSKAYSGQQGCVTIPARKCKTNVNTPDWAVGAKLVSKFLFNKEDITHLRRGSIWAETFDPEQKFTSFRIIECEPVDTGKCEINSEYSHIQFINAGQDLEKGFGLGAEEEPPLLKLSYEILLRFLKSFLEFIIWLKAAHLSGFSHNDIKLDNFCFDGTNVRLIDFSDRSHTVWGAVLKSKGLGSRLITFNNNKATMIRQHVDIDEVSEIIVSLLEEIMKVYGLSLKYAQAFKVAKHIFQADSNNNSSLTPLDNYTRKNTLLQNFLKIMIAQVSKIPSDELFASSPIDYKELFQGRELTDEEANCVKILKAKLLAEAFMQTWSEEDATSYEEAKAALNHKGGSRRSRRKRWSRLSRKTLRNGLK